jgi:hypothetical protein
MTVVRILVFLQQQFKSLPTFRPAIRKVKCLTIEKTSDHHFQNHFNSILGTNLRRDSLYCKDLGFQLMNPMLQLFQLGDLYPKVSRFALYPSIFKSTRYAIDDPPPTLPVESYQSKHLFFLDPIGDLVALDSSASLLPSQF